MSDQFLLEGEIDAASALAIERRLFAYLEESEGEAVLDCSGLTFVDSTGLTMLVRVKRAAGKRLILGDVPPFVYRLLVTTGLGDWFQLRYSNGQSPNGEHLHAVLPRHAPSLPGPAPVSASQPPGR